MDVRHTTLVPQHTFDMGSTSSMAIHPWPENSQDWCSLFQFHSQPTEGTPGHMHQESVYALQVLSVRLAGHQCTPCRLTPCRSSVYALQVIITRLAGYDGCMAFVIQVLAAPEEEVRSCCSRTTSKPCALISLHFFHSLFLCCSAAATELHPELVGHHPVISSDMGATHEYVTRGLTK